MYVYVYKGVCIFVCCEPVSLGNLSLERITKYMYSKRSESVTAGDAAGFKSADKRHDLNL